LSRVTMSGLYGGLLDVDVFCQYLAD